jgi:hypothetical protein
VLLSTCAKDLDAKQAGNRLYIIIKALNETEYTYFFFFAPYKLPIMEHLQLYVGVIKI